MEVEKRVDVAKWKSELNSNGFILCEKEACGMGFLSVRGMEVHFRTCTGFTADGGYVTCTGCPVRFKTFQIMERHREKSHGSKVIKAEPSKTSSGRRESDVPGLFSENLESRVETQEDLRLRILAESRQISTPRPVGRPPRKLEQQHNFPRTPVVQRRRDSSSKNEANTYPTSIELENIKSENSRLSMVAKEKQLAEQEKQLREYQERVLRYERLAEDAARVALQEKELRLKKLAQDLRQRELEAKEKLAKAVKSMEMIKNSTAEDQPPRTLEIVSKDSDEVQIIGDENSINSILPDVPDKSPESCENVDVIAASSAEGDDDEEMIVVDNNGSLESLLAKAQRGEVTLVAQAKDDGTLVLVENDPAAQDFVAHENLEKSPDYQEEEAAEIICKIETKPVGAQEDDQQSSEMILESVENLSDALESQKPAAAVSKVGRKRKSRPQMSPNKASDSPIAKRLRTSKESSSASNAGLKVSKPRRSSSKESNPASIAPAAVASVVPKPRGRPPKNQTKDVEKNPIEKVGSDKMSFPCGKCSRGFKTRREFDIHAATAHGCAARPKGEDQTIAEEEIIAKIQHCFKMKYVKKITCFKCNAKTFGTAPGFKYHWLTCGKSRQELDDVMESCPHCDYKGLPANFRSHVQTHAIVQEEDSEAEAEAEKEEDLEVSLTSTGRQNRKAASRASKRVSQVFKNQDPAEALEDSEDEFKIEAKGDFKKKKDGSLVCLKCQKKCQSKVEFEQHFLNEHAEDLNEEEDDEDLDDDDDGSSIASGAADDDLEDDIVEDEPPSSSKSPMKSKGRIKSAPLGVDQSIVSMEKKFRANNYEFNAFEKIAIVPWQPLKLTEADQCQKSVMFNMKKDSFQKTCRQGVFHEAETLSFYTGGPITASDWCPAFIDKLEMIAVATKEFDTSSNSANVQLWTFESKNPANAPVLR